LGIVVGGSLALSARAAIIVGGPTYDATTQTGYQSASALSFPVGTESGGAVAVGGAIKYISGATSDWHVVRWDTSGAAAVELGNLGIDPNGTSGPYAINSAGTAVGYSQKVLSGTYVGDRAVRWDASGTVTELGNLGISSYDGTATSGAVAINTAGTTVGSSEKYVSGNDMGSRAVRWDASGTAVTELGNLGTSSNGYTQSHANAINTAGTIVGDAYRWGPTASTGSRAVRWNAGGTAATELGNLGTDSSGFTTSSATAVNDAGTAVGSAIKYVAGVSKFQHAVRWDAGGIAATELGSLGTDSDGRAITTVTAINATGTSVGYGDKWVSGINKGRRAIRWDATGTAATELRNLGTDSNGKTFGEAVAINAAGISVGAADDYDPSNIWLGTKAVAWGPDGAAIDLNTLLPSNSGWNLTWASGITDTSWASGYGYFDPDGPGGQDAYGRLFLLDVSSVVPEPGTFGFIAFCGITLLSRRREYRTRPGAPPTSRARASRPSKRFNVSS
jgi:hypothetical protein